MTTEQQLSVLADRAAGFCYRWCSTVDGWNGRFHVWFKAVKADYGSNRSSVQAQGVCVEISGLAEA